MTPEENARQQIGTMLIASGWVVQDDKQFNPSAGPGIALREAPLKSGTCDYLLQVDRKAVGIAEAKKQGTLLSGVAEQSGHYAENLLDFIQSSHPARCHFFTNPPASKPSSATNVIPNPVPAACSTSIARKPSPRGLLSLGRSVPGSRPCQRITRCPRKISGQFAAIAEDVKK
jgi:hypothetical protein